MNGANPDLQQEGNDSRHLCSLPPNGENPNYKRALRDMVEALREQDFKYLDMLLQSRVDPDFPSRRSMNSYLDSKHNYPLFVAVDNANSDILTALLNAGADVNAVSDDGESIVCFAIKNVIKDEYFSPSTERRDRVSTVRLLLQHGADANVLAPGGRSPLCLTVTAVKEARRTLGLGYRDRVIESLRILVKHGAQLHDSPCQLGGNVNTYRRSLDTLTLTTLGGEDYFIVARHPHADDSRWRGLLHRGTVSRWIRISVSGALL